MENKSNKNLSLFCTVVSISLVIICLLFIDVQNELNRIDLEIKIMKNENKSYNAPIAGVTKATIEKVKCKENEYIKNEDEKENENVDNFNKENEYDSLELLAKCVFAEAGNQGLYGQELVACVILNRVDSNNYPNTVEDVIKQKKSIYNIPKIN